MIRLFNLLSSAARFSFHVRGGTPTSSRSRLCLVRMTLTKSSHCALPVLLLSVNPLDGAEVLSINPVNEGPSISGEPSLALLSGDPLAYRVVDACKINKVTIKSNNKLVIRINISPMNYLQK